MPVHMFIKQSTSAAHAKVDELFSAFDLAEPRFYGGFLRAHARALVPLEQLLLDDCGLPCWAPRSSLLLDDLEALNSSDDIKFPAGICSGITNHGARFGALYVLEGSRFGAAVLKARVPSGLQRAFLSADAKLGNWSGFLAALECAAIERPPIWLDEVVMGARIAFDLFAASAVEELQILKQPARAASVEWRPASPTMAA